MVQGTRSRGAMNARGARSSANQECPANHGAPLLTMRPWGGEEDDGDKCMIARPHQPFRVVLHFAADVTFIEFTENSLACFLIRW